MAANDRELLQELEELEALEARDKAAKAQMSGGQGADEGKIGMAEAGLSMGSGMLGSAVGGIAGLVGAALPGEPGQGARVAQSVQNALTYKPRTEHGKTLTEAASYPFAKLAELADYAGGGVSEATGSPLLGTAVNTGINALPFAVGGAARFRPAGEAPAAVPSRAPMGSPERFQQRQLQAQQMIASELDRRKGGTGQAPDGVERRAQEAVPLSDVAEQGPSLIDRMLDKSNAQLNRNARKNETLQRAQDEGFVTYPEGLAGKGLMKAGGVRNVEQKGSIQNAETATNIGRKEAGLGPDEPMSPENFAEARNRMAAPYREVAAMSPEAFEALDTLEKARYDMQKWRDYHKQSGDPRAETRANRYEAVATKQERLIDSIAEGSKNPQLLQQLRAARTAIAKNMDVQRATNTATGELDPQAIGRMYKANPDRFSGGLETIGRFANTNPKMTQPPSRVGTPRDLSGGIPAARGIASSLALNKMLQPGVPRPGIGVRLADVATRNPYALGVAPSLGLRPPEE